MPHLGAITARLHQHSATWQRPAWFTRDTCAGRHDEDVDRIVSVVRDRLPEIQGDPISVTVCVWTESEDSD